jgi:hypothetical protein
LSSAKLPATPCKAPWPPVPPSKGGKAAQEILRLIKRYIGVSNDGYLGDFTYRTHEEFYPEFCGLDVNGKRALNNHE